MTGCEIERLRQENERSQKQVVDRPQDRGSASAGLRHQNSTITSKPPSSDGLAGQPRVQGRRVKSRRKPGGQPRYSLPENLLVFAASGEAHAFCRGRAAEIVATIA
jgi:hypothetical protein